jgi:hypothetical protein
MLTEPGLEDADCVHFAQESCGNGNEVTGFIKAGEFV